MVARTLDVVKSDYITSMGEDLGLHFFELHRKLGELHIVWKQYRQLFGEGDEIIRLLNRTAGLFFKIVQDELWDSVLMGIARMTDASKMRSNRNLTIFSLPPLIADEQLKAEVEELCRSALKAAGVAREHRNKRVAHQDYGHAMNQVSKPLSGVSRAHIEEVLSALSSVLNAVEHHFRESEVMYQNFIDQSGARVLVGKLRRTESGNGLP